MGTQFLFQPHHLGTSRQQGILGGSGYAEGIEMFSGGFMFLSCIVILALRCKKVPAYGGETGGCDRGQKKGSSRDRGEERIDRQGSR